MLPMGVHSMPDVSGAIATNRGEVMDQLYAGYTFWWEDDFDEYLTFFLGFLMQSDYQAVATMLRGSDAEFYSYIRDVDFATYEVIRQATDQSGYAKGYVIKLTVLDKRTDNETFPIGDSYWQLGINHGEYSGIFLLRQCWEDDEPTLSAYDPNMSEHYRFCYSFSYNLGVYSTGDDFNAMLKDHLTWDNHLHNILHYYDNAFYYASDPVCRYLLGVQSWEPGGATAISAFMENLAGVIDVDFSNYRLGNEYFSYDPLTDSIQQCGHGGSWLFWNPISTGFDEETGVFTTEIVYYADMARFLVARIIQYNYRENPDGTFTMLSTHLVYDSGAKLMWGNI